MEQNLITVDGHESISVGVSCRWINSHHLLGLVFIRQRTTVTSYLYLLFPWRPPLPCYVLCLSCLHPPIYFLYLYSDLSPGCPLSYLSSLLLPPLYLAHFVSGVCRFLWSGSASSRSCSLFYVSTVRSGHNVSIVPLLPVYWTVKPTFTVYSPKLGAFFLPLSRTFSLFLVDCSDAGDELHGCSFTLCKLDSPYNSFQVRDLIQLPRHLDSGTEGGSCSRNQLVGPWPNSHVTKECISSDRIIQFVQITASV